MSTLLSKLHVRFIQTQTNFSFQRTPNAKNEKLPLSQLYIKDSGHFYFANTLDALKNSSTLTLSFKEKNDYLSALQCDVNVETLASDSDEYEEASLFFQEDASLFTEIVCLTIVEIRSK